MPHIWVDFMNRYSSVWYKELIILNSSNIFPLAKHLLIKVLTVKNESMPCKIRFCFVFVFVFGENYATQL